MLVLHAFVTSMHYINISTMLVSVMATYLDVWLCWTVVGMVEMMELFLYNVTSCILAAERQLGGYVLRLEWQRENAGCLFSFFISFLRRKCSVILVFVDLFRSFLFCLLLDILILPSELAGWTILDPDHSENAFEMSQFATDQMCRQIMLKFIYSGVNPATSGLKLIIHACSEAKKCVIQARS